MANRLASASATSCTIGGVLAVDGLIRHTWELVGAATIFIVAGAVGAVLSIVLYVLRHHLAEVTEREQRADAAMREREQALERQKQALARQEKAFDRRMVVGSLRIASLTRALDDTRNENTRLRTQNFGLMKEMDEVNAERNQLIVNELLATGECFTTKAYGRTRLAVGGTTKSRALPRAPRRTAEATARVGDHDV